MDLKEKTYDYLQKSGLNEILTFIFKEALKEKPKDLYNFSINLLKKKQHKIICLNGKEASNLKWKIKNTIKENEIKFLDFENVKDRNFDLIYEDLKFFSSNKTHFVFILNFPNNIIEMKQMFDKSIFPDQIFLFNNQTVSKDRTKELKRSIQKNNFKEIKSFNPKNTFFLELDDEIEKDNFLFKNLLALNKIHNKSPNKILLFIRNQEKNEEITKILAEKIDTRTINSNFFLDENKNIKKNELLKRLSLEDIKLQGCIFYNFPIEEMNIKNFMKNIEFFEQFNIIISDENSKEKLLNCYGSNSNIITIDTENKTEYVIQKIIHNLFYFN